VNEKNFFGIFMQSILHGKKESRSFIEKNPASTVPRKRIHRAVGKNFQ
jgi:hypothetical protein